MDEKKKTRELIGEVLAELVEEAKGGYVKKSA
jgi:hypothetical protein